MTSRPKNKLAGGLQCPPNHLIVKLWSMKGHPEMGQSQNTEETAIANQLHNCHTSLFAQSQVLHKCLCESVAHLSRCIFVALAKSAGVKCCKYVYANRCRYVTVANMSVKCGIYVFRESLHKCHCGQNVTSRGKNVTLPKCHRGRQTPLRWKMTPPMENDRTPSDGK